jgi:hypothetical protein
VYFGASILNWAYLPQQDKVILEKFEESGSCDFITSNATSGGKGERITTKLSTNSVTIESLGYTEREVSPYTSGSLGAPYYVSRSYHWGANGFYVHAVSVSGLEENIYSYIKSISYDRQSDMYGEKRKNQLIYNILASNCATPSPSPSPSPNPPPSTTTNKIQLPNHPQHFKRMNCCAEVKEIYKYLGIGKLKRNKFPVSKAFLVPGGSGNDNCFDYYAIMQALFRMLANGLIINPKSKPLGSEWQNTNATAWASAMYEMMAESMSDGNSTQRFEVAAIMQLTQMMATLAENGRKIEFVADAIGLEPLPVVENVPVCFTIYEGHKGFGKKEPKKINVSGLKTDNDVENVLGKMLNPSLIPITAWKFKPGQISINEGLRNG